MPQPDSHLFPTHHAFEAWLRKNHASSDGVWLLISKADAEKPSVTYAEVVEVAICYGWIDGQKKARLRYVPQITSNGRKRRVPRLDDA